MSRGVTDLDQTSIDAMEHQAQYAQADRLRVRFYIEAFRDEAKSAAAGRPVFVDTECIEIMIPGDRDEIRRRPVRWGDADLWPKQYAAFKNGNEAKEEGTPLDALPFLTKAQVEEFKVFGLRTAENVANMNDNLKAKFQGMHGVVARVRDFLAAAAKNAPIDKMRSELEQRDAQIAAMEKMLKEQGSALDSLMAKQKKS